MLTCYWCHSPDVVIDDGTQLHPAQAGSVDHDAALSLAACMDCTNTWQLHPL